MAFVLSRFSGFAIIGPSILILLSNSAWTAGGAQEPAVDLQRAVEAGLQADAKRSVEILRGLPANAFSGRDADYRDCVIERFGGDGPPAAGLAYVTDPFTRGVVDAFHKYWWRVTTQRETPATAEAALSRQLASAIDHPETAADRDRLEQLLKDALDSRGVHVLLGITSPLRELMLWTREDVRTYKVDLPEETHETKVVILDGLMVAGWTDYVTCGRHGAGGWAVADALYAVRARYDDLEGENFKVTFLGHETQHFADLNRFKGLKPWELEYRAKLVEVAQADITRARVLQMFRSNQSDDPGQQHAYANRRVIVELSRRLGLPPSTDLSTVEPEVLRGAAAAALAADSGTRSR